ncbi:MAG: UbiA family prenyltransferase [Planctomycetes bacterium]|nr:UbiA family prenyltransferase [Planctomycetota bacterium]
MATESQSEKRVGRLGVWIELFRIPNFATLPGDIIAGFCLVGGTVQGTVAELLGLVLASVFLYGFGLALNDLLDLKRDSQERPDRPLPSGRIPLKHVRAVLAFLGIAGAAAAATAGFDALLIALGLLIFIVLYNGPGRRIGAFGFFLMGVCRGGNVILGGSIALPAQWSMLYLVAAIEAVYIACVTALASRETEGPIPAKWRTLVPLIPAAGLGILIGRAGFSWTGLAAAVAAVGFVRTALCGNDSVKNAAPVIGSLIRALIPLQVAYIVIVEPDASWWALPVCLLWPLAKILSYVARGS